MRAEPKPNLQRAIDSRLSQRLRDLVDDLDRREAEIAAEIKGGDVSPTVAARSMLVAACEEELRRHCERIVADLLAFSAEKEATGTDSNWFCARFEAHVDTATSRLVRWLADHRCAGVAGTPAEGKRLRNLSLTIKAHSRVELSRGAIASRRAAPDAAATPGMVELDDRLPLRRRGVFDRDVLELAQSAAVGEEPLSLVMIDIDRFKNVNDELGHPVGDEVLLAVSQMVIRRLGHKGRAYRYGGDEFALLLPGYSADEAVGLAERIRKDVTAVPVSSKRLVVTASFGVACLPDHASDVPALVESADRALYLAKRDGRNCVRSGS